MSDCVAERVLAELKRRGETLATAESLTGGLIGDLLTSVPGASAVYRGGVITYATELKATLAGVSAETLAADGAVAESTAAQMAGGVAERCAADWGVSATGVAGPDRQEGHPVGTVFVAVTHISAAEPLVRVERLMLSGSRSEIRHQAALGSLALLDRTLGMLGDRSDVM